MKIIILLTIILSLSCLNKATMETGEEIKAPSSNDYSKYCIEGLVYVSYL